MVNEMGYKPIVNTNGVALTDDLLAELVKAGVKGFTFHVDSKQARPGWKGKNELELNDLRDELADLAFEVGVGASFNATVHPDTLQYVRPMMRWAEERMDRVDVMLFILMTSAIFLRTKSPASCP